MRIHPSRGGPRPARLRRRARRGLRSLRRAFSGPAGVAGLVVVPLATVVCIAAADGFPAEPRAEAVTPGATAFEPAGSPSLRRFAEVRRRSVGSYASAFRIGEELAGLIFETALREGLDPELAFRLVRVESSFRRGAVGPAGSIGLAQVRPSTARWLEPAISRDRLFDPETNLRLGFRYLRLLLDRYGGDPRLALLAYNRGPGTVTALLALGEDPSNGYASRVLEDD